MNILLLIFLYIVWGTTYTAIVYALEGFEPFAMAGWRFLVAGLFFAPMTKLEHWKLKNSWPSIVGGIGLATGNALVVWSQTIMPSGLAALFIGSVPLWLILLDWLFYSKTKPHPLSMMGCFVGLIGLYLLSVQTGADLSLRTSAIALIAAALFWSVGTLVIRNAKVQLTRRSALSVQLVYGGVFQQILAFFNGEAFFPKASALESAPLWAWIYLVVFGSILAMNAYNYLLTVTSPAIIGTYALANPVVALILGHLLFDEEIGASTILSGVLVLVGVALILASGRVRPLVPTKYMKSQ
tara:strand:- start:9716 stop:10606 length:891 start_codon:yes stop_codon:yes gene_type:complete